MLALLAVLALGGQVPGASRADTTGRPPAIVTRAPLDTASAVNVRVLAAPETVYVGQQSTYELGVFLDTNVRDRMRRLEAIAPEMRGLMAYEPPATASGFPTRSVGQHRYEARVYERAVFPLTPGRIAIPPARLVYAMPLTYSFFSHEETYELRSDSAIVVAIEPPEVGRPADWNGAVGTLHIASHIDNATGRVGNPILLTVAVAGRGNVNLFPRPQVAIPWASTVPTVERVTLAPDSLDIRGVKEFDWLVTPQRDGRLTIPEIHYSYFDPDSRRYETAVTPAMPVAIAPGTLAGSDTGAVAPRYALRSTYRGPLAPEPYTRMPFWWLVSLAPVPAIAIAVARRPRRARRPATPARALLALTRAPDPPPTRELRRAFLRAVAARVRSRAFGTGPVPATLAEPGVLARAARRAGVSTGTATAAAALVEELDTAAFASGGNGAARATRELAKRVERTYRAIDREACRPRGVPVTAAAIALLVIAAGARAASADGDAALFARGVEAYQSHDFAAAERVFANITSRVPRAADAWANFGTAAYSAGDTAGAAIGWQRALRIEPLAGDARDRLEMLGAASGLGSVPAIPPAPVALIAAALWIVAWVALAWNVARRRASPSARPLIAGGIAIAVALGALAAAVDARLAGRGLVVVTQDAPLHELPALASDRSTTLRPGEIARVVEREGPWARVVTDGGRHGWAESDDLTSLARD